MDLARARLALVVALALVVVTVLTGCTRKNERFAAAPPPGPGQAQTARLRVSEYRLYPINTTARPGRLTLIAHNSGRLAHDVSVVREGTVLARTTTIAPGETAAMQVTVQPGLYRLLSSLSNDETLGLHGFLVVE